jgi:hypothetical protein
VCDPSGGEAGECVADRRIGFQPGDHLDNFHQGHRVEEMESGKSLWILKISSNGGHGKGGCNWLPGTACEPTIASSSAKRPLFDIDPFNNRFHDQAAIR